MADELNLQLKKPLDKMTAKELRELVVNQIPQITGAFGMSKEDILAAIKNVFGMDSEEGSKGISPYKPQIQSLKKQIKTMRESKLSLDGRAERGIIRKKINKLKKRTRRLASASL